MVFPLVGLIGALGFAGILSLLLGGAGAFAIITNAKLLIIVLGGIIGLFLLVTLFKK